MSHNFPASPFPIAHWIPWVDFLLNSKAVFSLVFSFKIRTREENFCAANTLTTLLTAVRS